MTDLLLLSSITNASLSQYLPAIIISLLFALAGTWLSKKAALKLGIVDKPDDLVKTHKSPVAYLGGIGICMGFIIGLLAVVFLLNIQVGLKLDIKLLIGIIVAGLIACIIGTIDDIHNIKPYQKILAQIAAAVVLVLAGIKPNIAFFAEPMSWQLPQSLEMAIAVLISLIFVLGATNSLNLIDGLDGLCAGVTAIIAIGFTALAILLQTQNPDSSAGSIRIIVSLCLLGSVCGFLPFNWNPAKIFMGDAGSLFLGVICAALMMLFAAEDPIWCLCSIAIFGLPILDTAVAFARRALNKRPFFVSDRGHIYDQMMDRGNTLKKTVLTCYAISAAFAACGILMGLLRPVYAIIAFGVIVTVSALVIWKKGFLKMQGLRGAIQNTL
jgi:UDP-GlcNAc:undecaprenyl-phosphate/decaprenyl-phosphate GlcNAc-1-phosphate transferase